MKSDKPKSEWRVLGLDTTTRFGSIAVTGGGQTLAEWRQTQTLSHGEQSLPEIERLLKQLNLRLDDIDVFAVAVGPGSFTGIRTGISTIKAFAYALAKPVAAVPTLHAVAWHEVANLFCLSHDCDSQHAVRETLSTVQAAVMLPAARGELFFQLLRFNEPDAVEVIAPAHSTLEAICTRPDMQKTSTVFCGDVARTQAALLKHHANHFGIKLIGDGSNAGEATTRESQSADYATKLIKQFVEQGTRPTWVLASSPPTTLAACIAHLALRQTTFDSAQSLQALYVRPAEVKTINPTA